MAKRHTQVIYGPDGTITVVSARRGIAGLRFKRDVDGDYVQQGVTEGKQPIVFHHEDPLQTR